MLRSLNVRIIVTSFETFHHRKPILFHLRTIDFIVYALKRIQKKLVNKSEKCVLLRYEGEFIFRLYNLIKKKIIRINNVHFVEKRPLIVNPEEKTNVHEPSIKRQRLYVSAFAVKKALDEQRITDISKDIVFIMKSSTTASAPAINRSRSNFPWSAEKQTPTLKPSSPARAVSPIAFARVFRSIVASLAVERITRSLTVVEMVREDLELSAIQRVLLDYSDTTISNLRDLSPDPLSRTFAAFALLTDHVNKPNIFEPTTYQQVISNQLSRMHWELVMQDEYKSLINNNTWCLVQAPSDAHILRGRWVYTVKRGLAEEVTRYKARWVVRGFEQQKGRDYHDTFASVVKFMSYKAIFALAAALNWDVK